MQSIICMIIRKYHRTKEQNVEKLECCYEQKVKLIFKANNRTTEDRKTHTMIWCKVQCQFVDWSEPFTKSKNVGK